MSGNKTSATVILVPSVLGVVSAAWIVLSSGSLTRFFLALPAVLMAGFACYVGLAIGLDLIRNRFP